MTRTAVASSNLASVGYEVDCSTLEVEFHSGAIYQYFQVPESRFVGLMTASSHGHYFDLYIKEAGYPFRRIR